MTYVSLVISEVAAAACIRELGVLGCIQFTDLNPEVPPFLRPYISNIKRCDEMERKIRYIHGEIKKLGMPVQNAGSIVNFVNNVSGRDSVSFGAYILEGIENKLDQYEEQLIELNKYATRLNDEYITKVSSLIFIVKL